MFSIVNTLLEDRKKKKAKHIAGTLKMLSQTTLKIISITKYCVKIKDLSTSLYGYINVITIQYVFILTPHYFNATVLDNRK